MTRRQILTYPSPTPEDHIFLAWQLSKLPGKHELLKRRYNQLTLNRKAGLPVTVTLDDVLVAVFGVNS